MPNTDKTILLPQLQRYDEKIKGWANNRFLTKTDASSLPPATATTLGGVKVGYGLSVTDDGVLSAEDDIVFTWDFDTSAFSCNKTFAEVKKITTTGVRRTATVNGLLENFSITLLVGAANDNSVVFFGTAPNDALGAGMLDSRTEGTITYLFQNGLVIIYASNGQIQMTEDLSNLNTNMSFEFKNTTFQYDRTNSFDLKDGGVTSAKLADGAVTEPKLASDAVTTYKIANNAITTNKIKDGAITRKKIEDGSISTTKLAPGAVDRTSIRDDAIESNHIRDNQIMVNHIKDGSVTSAKLALGAVAAENIQEGAIVSTHINDGIITTAKLADNAVTAVKLASNAVTTNKIADGAITKAKLASDVNAGDSKLKAERTVIQSGEKHSFGLWSVTVPKPPESTSKSFIINVFYNSNILIIPDVQCVPASVVSMTIEHKMVGKSGINRSGYIAFEGNSPTYVDMKPAGKGVNIFDVDEVGSAFYFVGLFFAV